MTDLVEACARAILESDAEIATDIAHKSADRIFEIVRMNGMLMPTVGGAIMLGCLAARQVLGDTIAFAQSSMDGASDDAATVKAATLQLFDELMLEIRALASEGDLG